MDNWAYILIIYSLHLFEISQRLSLEGLGSSNMVGGGLLKLFYTFVVVGTPTTW